MANRNIFYAAFAMMAVSCVMLTDAIGQEMRVTVPQSGAEGADSLQVFSGMAFRYQTLYPGSFFASLPATHQTITGVYLRPDASVTSGSMTNYGNIKIEYSTTSKTPEELTANFSANHGPDRVTVLDRALTLATAATGGPNGPRGFDYYFPFDTPFDFDPTAGNLLTEVSSSTGPDNNNLIFDVFNSPSFTDGGVSFSAGALDPRVFSIQFAVIPEPATALPFAAFLCGLLAFRSRRR
jgi:hypothetical protein